MTTIAGYAAYPSAYSSPYAAGVSGATTGAGSAGTASTAAKTANTTSSTDSATTITLSESARAAMASQTDESVMDGAREALDELMAGKDVSSPYAATGKLAIDLSGLDRRSLFAIASNGGGRFSADEQRAASGELSARFDAAMSGPAAVARVTGDMDGLYSAARRYLDSASDEERASAAWRTASAALDEARAELADNPSRAPQVAGDPVADYLARVETGDTAGPRDFADVADDARAALDKQIADAEASGKDLIFAGHGRNGVPVDFSQFASRTLSSIALNEGDQFSAEEQRAASSEMKTRAGQALLSCMKQASGSGDPTMLAQNIISAYASISAEERSAAGWGEDLYETALVNYRSAAQIASMFGDGGATGILGGRSLSLANYM